MNRAADIAVATAAIAVAAPAMLLAAAAVRLLDGSPVLFRQTRIGKDGAPFEILKFRTMSVSPVRDGFDAGSTRRVTGVGRVLRRTKVDELPQLVNVLRGDMSVVGPRPEVAEYVDRTDPRWREVLSRRPGITDWASVEYFDEEAVLARAADPRRAYREEVLPRKLDLQLRYVRDPGPAADAAILYRTVRRAILGR